MTGLPPGRPAMTPRHRPPTDIVARYCRDLEVTQVRNWRCVSIAPGFSHPLTAPLLSAFTHLSSPKMKVSEWAEHDSDRFNAERAMPDETAAHLLLACPACVVNAVTIVIGLNSALAQKKRSAALGRPSHSPLALGLWFCSSSACQGSPAHTSRSTRYKNILMASRGGEEDRKYRQYSPVRDDLARDVRSRNRSTC